jgi:Uncharacterized conserved protein
MAESSVKLDSLLNSIDEKKLVLPDFQRDYVWIKEDEKIEDFITSILSQLPIGSIITFKDNFKSFANKEIGFNKKIEYNDDFDKVEFLLDGQQRITTLSLVFSDRIFSKVKKDPVNYPASKLVQSDKIKKRYFLKMPRYDSDNWEDDFFGLQDLHFPFEEPDKIPFCSNDIKELIHTKTFTFSTNDSKKDEWYYPTAESYKTPKMTNKIKDKAIDEGLIPLYLLTDNSIVIKRILTSMAENRCDFIKDTYKRTKIDDIKTYILEHPEIYNISLSQDDESIYNEFIQVLENNKSEWADNMHSYLNSCIKQLKINAIDVDDENTSRAINMYEALNKGGAKLTTYDLIIARAACLGQYNQKGYAELNKEIISEYYNSDLLNILTRGFAPEITTWNSKDFLKTITSNGEIVPVVINQFLNLLCFVACNANPKPDFKMNATKLTKISNEYCKAKKQLELKADQIVDYSELALKSVMDALMVLQFKCGIYNISQIDYNLILFPLSYIMYLYESKSVDSDRLGELVDKLCGIYYYCIFTGEYQSDQSTVVMKHLEWVHNWILCDEKPIPFTEEKIVESIDNSVLNISKYNDLATLLYENDSAPKKAVRNSLLQFVLSLQPSDFIKNEQNQVIKLNAWSEGSGKKFNFEIHHMIPLASATSIKESTKQLRDENIMINSPLNLAFISKDANRAISNYQISQYKSLLDSTFLNGYKLPPSVLHFNYERTKESELKEILKYRYDALKSDIITKIRYYIS